MRVKDEKYLLPFEKGQTVKVGNMNFIVESRSRGRLVLRAERGQRSKMMPVSTRGDMEYNRSVLRQQRQKPHKSMRGVPLRDSEIPRRKLVRATGQGRC